MSLHEDGIPAEFELVRLAGRPAATEGGLRRLRALASGAVDWPRVCRIGERHGVQGLMVRSLERRVADLVPDEARRSLREAAMRQAVRSLAQAGELLEVLEALDALDIRAVPYKGPTLSLQLYGSAALRDSCDIDLLVAPRNVAVARTVLLEKGYGERSAMAGARGSYMLESRYHHGFKRDGGPRIELHWGFTNADVAFPLSLEDLEPRLTEVRLGGRAVPAFAWDDLILILSVHGAKHLWSRLEWIVGLAEAARRIPEESWEGVFSRARDLRCHRTLLLGLHLANEHAGLTLPERASTAISGDPAVVELAAEVLAVLLDEAPLPESERRTLSLENDLFRIRLREGLRERMRYLTYRFTTPSRSAEWRIMDVGGRPVPLHGVVRPIRALFRLMPAMWNHSLDRRGPGPTRVSRPS